VPRVSSGTLVTTRLDRLRFALVQIMGQLFNHGTLSREGITSPRRLLLELGLRRRLQLSMAHGEVSRGRFSGVEGVAAGDFGGVGEQNGDAVSTGSREACSQLDSIYGLRGEGGEREKKAWS
jgi:hypothetical protein